MDEETTTDDASSGDKGESGGVDAKRDIEGSERTEVMRESAESVLVKDEVLISARKVYSIEGFGLSTSGGMSNIRREKHEAKSCHCWITDHHRRRRLLRDRIRRRARELEA